MTGIYWVAESKIIILHPQQIWFSRNLITSKKKTENTRYVLNDNNNI